MRKTTSSHSTSLTCVNFLLQFVSYLVFNILWLIICIVQVIVALIALLVWVIIDQVVKSKCDQVGDKCICNADEALPYEGETARKPNFGYQHMEIQSRFQGLRSFW